MFEIRKAIPEDCPTIYQFILELARFEKAEEKVLNSPEQLRKDGFGENPLYECLIAEVDGKAVGISLYYFRYSTWKGKVLFLEDLIVTESERGKSYGKKLLDATIEKAKELNCKGIRWQVLNWNIPAIEFYKKYDMEFDEEWIDVKKFF